MFKNGIQNIDHNVSLEIGGYH